MNRTLQQQDMPRNGCGGGNSRRWWLTAPHAAVRLGLAVLVVASGCQWPAGRQSTIDQADVAHYQTAAKQVEYPLLENPVDGDAHLNARPLDLTDDLANVNYWNLSLEEAIRSGLQNSKVMKNLGATLLRTPGSVTTTFDPAIRENDPRFGTHAALSAFDASFAASVFHQNNDRALNNQFFGGGTRLLTQEATVMQGQISKQTASGTEFIIRSITDYDKNNAPGNRFPGAWNSSVETEFRQPLLRGYGIDYWQTVGASETLGVYTGVLIARTNLDISEAEFEIAVRDFIAEIENSYWDLYFAYQNLDTKVAARDASLELWRRLDALNQLGRAGGEADKEAQAREQYFRFQEDVQNALNGRPVDGTRVYNGAPAGAFKGTSGVLTAERRLRYLAGLPINDTRLIRPADEPLGAPVQFEWETVLEESLAQRPELRRQKWTVKQKELELVAAEKLMLPEMDVVGLYRWRGFGETLTNPSDGGAPRFDSAWGDLASGNFQEWQLGVEMDIPFGNRRAHAGLRNAEFQLARARQVLNEQERLVVHDLSNAISEAKRARTVLDTVKNRLDAAEDQVNAMLASFEADQTSVNLVLEAQRRYASARSAYYSAVIEYNLAIRNVHYEKGSYLSYCGVHLSEGPWSEPALQHAERMKRRDREFVTPPPFVKPPHFISNGDVPTPDQPVPHFLHPLDQPAGVGETDQPTPVNQEAMPELAPPPQKSPSPEATPQKVPTQKTPPNNGAGSSTGMQSSFLPPFPQESESGRAALALPLAPSSPAR